MPIIGKGNDPTSIPVMELEQGPPVNICDACPLKGNDGMQIVAELALSELMAERVQSGISPKDAQKTTVIPADIERIRPSVREMAEHLTETPVQLIKSSAELALQALRRFPPGGTERLTTCVNRKLAKTCIEYAGQPPEPAKPTKGKARTGRDVTHALR